MHQGSCHTWQNIQICNNEVRDPKHEQFFLTKMPKPKIKQLN
jgi:hypothetical protein